MWLLGIQMNFKNIFLATLVAMPLTFLEVSAAGNASDKLRDTVIDKTIQAFEDGFNSLFENFDCLKWSNCF